MTLEMKDQVTPLNTSSSYSNLLNPKITSSDDERVQKIQMSQSMVK